MLKPKLRKKNRPRYKKELGLADRHRRMLELRRAGFTYEQCAEELGYKNRSGAQKAFKAALRKYQLENVEEMALLENERLEQAHVVMEQLLLSGNDQTKAAQAIVRISESRRRLFGVDKPSRTEVELQGSVSFLAHLTDEQLDQILEKAKNGKKVLTLDEESYKIIEQADQGNTERSNGSQRRIESSDQSGKSAPSDEEVI